MGETNNDHNLTEKETQVATELLSKLEPGVLPFSIFHEVARLVATPIIEIIPIRQNQSGQTEILLLRRDDSDPAWPNQLHVPGTVVRATDNPGSFKDAFDRILEGELGGVSSTKPHFVQNILHNSGRGMEVSQIYWVELSGGTIKNGEFHNANDLPDTIVKSQLDFISMAIDHYLETNQKDQ